MSLRVGQRCDPDSCIWPECGKVMRVFRVPALKALDTSEFYLRCNFCEYTRVQITAISSELVCDIHQDNDFKPTATDMFDWCERKIAALVQASRAQES